MSATTRTRSAPSPFDKDAADLILRSSDAVDFRVRRAILAEASPVFDDMFGVPQPSNASVDDPVFLTETSQTLEILLRTCYPIIDPIPATMKIKQLGLILEAARKYQMDHATVLMRRLLTSKYTKSDPVTAYCIACQHGLEKEAMAAARRVRPSDLGVLPQNAYPALNDISAGCYYRLLKFRRNVAAFHDSYKFCEAGVVIAQSRSKRNSIAGDLANATLSPVPHPFDRTDSSDMAIISSDNKVFNVHSSIIRLASTVLSEMLDRIIANLAGTSTLPCLICTDNSNVLAIFLQIIYPCEQPELRDIWDLYTLAPLAKKYKVNKIDQVLRAAARALIPSAPGPIYFLACKYGWTKEKDLAVRRIELHFSPQELQEMYTFIMEDVSASAYIYLLHTYAQSEARTR